MGLLRTLLVLIIVYYVFNFLGKYIFPLFIKKVVSNAEKKFREQQQTKTYSNSNEGKVGETVIDKKPANYKEGNKQVGDYVDYEEIKED